MSEKKFGDIYSKIKNYGLIPVIKPEGVNESVKLAEALASGGMNVAEIAFTAKSELKSAESAESVKKISAAFPDMLIIAGNVENPEHAKSAVESGAKAVFASESSESGDNGEVISYCLKNNIAVIPECSDAKNIEKALGMGLDVVKFFPAEKSGGLEHLKELSGKYPNVRFIPAGGITEDSFLDYLSEKSVIACCGSFMLKEEHINKNDFEKIKESAILIIQKMLGFDLAHLVINCDNAEQADRDSSKIESIFGLKKTDAGLSVANADILHFMKQRSYGKNGQIAICTNFIDRAVFYLKEAKKEFIDESARFDADGNLSSIYLDNIIGGFAFKLVRK